MVVDASALLAILLAEPEGPTFQTVLLAAPSPAMSAVNYWEVLVRARVLRGDEGAAEAERWLDMAAITIVPADREFTREAAAASQRFRSRAGGRLNLGDCFAYALAMREGDGLLYKGDDFPKTDVKSALEE